MARALLQASAIALSLAAIPLATSAMAEVDTGSYRDLDQFIDVFNLVKANYVDPVDNKTLIHGAIDGMLAALDPHSSYEDGADYDNLRIQTEGNYGGVGLSVTPQDGVLKVIAPQEDTPGWRAGIKSGDYITQIDGKELFSVPFEDAVGALRGTPGSKVGVTIVRPGRDKPITLTLTREKIVIAPVKWLTEGEIGIVDINTFSDQTGDYVRKAVAGIKAKLGHDPMGYVVDLRDNGGGLLAEAISVSDTFLDHGEIVSQRGRGKTDIQRYFATPGDATGGKPIVVLTNAGTASASEIVAGALQDHHRALIIGTRSFGKGSVQSLLPLGPHTEVRLTTARYYTPSGRSVQEGGIDPDVAVPQLSDPDYKSRPVFRENDLRKHLINQAKVDDSVLEEDTTPDKRLNDSADTLKKRGIDDYQLYYALKTIARLGGPTQVALIDKLGVHKPVPQLPPEKPDAGDAAPKSN
ncbi:S41 family peptidase [Sphingomonas sp. GlSt437]|uniref:S41 family peptidase n=1 Tax=Sphingomonas sp. GlSt437 TaxID=3389970 RepID=UPI003A8C843B